MKLPIITAATALLLSALSPQVSAVKVTVEVQNLTQGIYFTPLLVAAHDDSINLFTPGMAASANLQMMAEGGDISGLSADVLAVSGQVVENPASGLLAPGASTTTTVIDTDGTTNNYLSIVSMLLPTNDAFGGLNAWSIPNEAGTYTINISAYDAGTEANNELVIGMAGGAPGTLGIPAAPGGLAGTGGTGVTSSETNQTVHIHRGSLGDGDISAGTSDLDNTVHRWLNPVLRATVTVEL